MTREDAIYEIKQLAVLSNEKNIDRITEALNMAIEALKAPIYAAELVRCGECIYWKNSLCQAWHRVIPKDGYCSIGKREGE